MGDNISVLGVPTNLGQSLQGVDLGPQAIRGSGLIHKLLELKHQVIDVGNVVISNIKDELEENPQINNLKLVEENSGEIAKQVESIIKMQSFPLILGGDHSVSIGSIAGISKQYRNLGVIWIDAHVDMNTGETSPSGNLHGMSLAIALGKGHPSLVNLKGYAPKVKPENVVIIGARDVDEGERELIRKLGVKIYTMYDIERLGMKEVIFQSIDRLYDCDGVHLSVDLDHLDPFYAPGVGTPSLGGLTYRETRFAMELLYEAGIVTSAEFVEVNPLLDKNNATASLTVNLISSLFGSRVI